ncbi:dTMP kinase [Corallococcus sp. ZKHCc1 1396]|uniref:Thymidylate kinase n=1 Tax=Corallococcus soli TaxID=2710757 RepID=A0ABR9PIR6_9BACT|nr:dTMP kinase [Corallococcus soli]
MPKTKKRGVLVAIEGIDGAGKTTQARLLEEALLSGGHKVVRTKEPTDGTWGRSLRESATKGRLPAEAELDLFLRDRREHVEKLIEPALAAGKVVIIDRYYFSTVAYQGARGMDPAELLKMNEAFAPPPDLLVILDVEPLIGIERIRQRGDRQNDFEQASGLREAARIFRTLDLPYLARIPGTHAPEDITAGILEILYDGPLAGRPVVPSSISGRPMTNGDLWMDLAKIS